MPTRSSTTKSKRPRSPSPLPDAKSRLPSSSHKKLKSDAKTPSKKELPDEKSTTGRSKTNPNQEDYLHPSGYTIKPELEGETPYDELCRLVKDGEENIAAGEAMQEGKGNVVYWMRMKDLRLRDNLALSRASALARSSSSHLIVLFVLSPSDYKSHDRSARRIDFVLRNLTDLRSRLSEMDIPLVVLTHEKRKEIPKLVLDKCAEWRAKAVWGNMEHEVDELRRDIELIKLARSREREGKGETIAVRILHHLCIIPPGEVTTKEGKVYTVYSPWFKNWSSMLSTHASKYLREASPAEPNDSSIRKDKTLSPLFDHPVPPVVTGFELDKDDAERMHRFWPHGEEAAAKVLENFVKLQPGARPKGFLRPPVEEKGEGEAKGKGEANKKTRVSCYDTDRNRPDVDGTSRLSPYLAAGVISPRHCLRSLLPDSGASIDSSDKAARLPTERSTGAGMWLQEVGWRDFYQHVLAAFPRVCMGHAFQKKFDLVKWERGEGSEELKAWIEGRTGFPIVDAGMRQVLEQGYMHNRVRMCTAMFLSKDLLIDWRHGEKYFMQNLMDGDFAANNGGWQWSASTGTDPQPYFRIFNPTLQSEKSDVTGEYIKHFVPELRGLSGKDLHDPYGRLSKAAFEKLGYPKPIVDHSMARKRAIARFKEPGTEAVE